jgi:hypothetical protein
MPQAMTYHDLFVRLARVHLTYNTVARVYFASCSVTLSVLLVPLFPAAAATAVAAAALDRQPPAGVQA